MRDSADAEGAESEIWKFGEARPLGVQIATDRASSVRTLQYVFGAFERLGWADLFSTGPSAAPRPASVASAGPGRSFWILDRAPPAVRAELSVCYGCAAVSGGAWSFIFSSPTWLNKVFKKSHGTS